MKLLTVVAIVAFGLLPGIAEAASPTTCAGFAAQQGFNFPSFLGKYKVHHYAINADLPFPAPSCMTIEFRARAAENQYEMLLSTGDNLLPMNITVENPNDAGRWAVSSSLLPTDVTMIILWSDADHAVYITCAEIGDQAMVNEVSVISRNAEGVPDWRFESIRSLLGYYQVYDLDWKNIDHSSCTNQTN